MIKKFFSSELVKGSLILIIAINFFNLFNVIFHFISGRLLGPADYSIVASIISLAYIFSIPTEAIQTILSKYTTKFIKNEGKINNLLIKSLKKFFLISLICFVIFSLLSPIISTILKIDYKLIIFSGLMIFGIFLTPIARGVLQGKKKFNSLGFSFFVEGFFKVFAAILLILFGLRVYGAVGGIIISLFISLIILLYLIKDIFKIKSKREKIKGIYSYSYPTLISLGAIILFYSVDVILARAFFSPIIAGQYALISLFGKMIFFVTSPISKAMFPIISGIKKDKERRSLVKKSILFVLIIAVLGILFYILFANPLIKIFGKDFLGLERYILLPSIAMVFLSLTNIFIYYNLAINKLKRNLFLILLAILQIVLLCVFHQTIVSFMIAFIVSNAITFIFYVFAYFKCCQ